MEDGDLKDIERINKQYIEFLEDENKKLKDQVDDLSNQLQFYKNQYKTVESDVKVNPMKFKFLGEDRVAYDIFPHMISTSPENISVNTHLELWDKHGYMTDTRWRFIQESFKGIIDYSVPIGLKAFSMLINSLRKNTKSSIQRYQNFSSLKKADFLQKHDLSECERILFEYEHYAGVIDYLEKNSDDLMVTYDQLKEGLHELVKIKSKIKKILTSGHETNIRILSSTPLLTLNRIVPLFKQFNKPKLMNRKKVWGIPSKSDLNEGDNSDFYISDSDTE